MSDLKPVKNIYIVDADRAINEAFHYRLTQYSCETRSFYNHRDFFLVCKRKPPDLALMDLGENPKEGLEILIQIRTQLKASFPIIVLSSKHHQDLIIEAIRSGANDFIVKPPFRYDFDETLHRYVNPETALKESTEKNKVSETKGKSCIHVSAHITHIGMSGFQLITNKSIQPKSIIQIPYSEVSFLELEEAKQITFIVQSCEKQQDNQFYVNAKLQENQNAVTSAISHYLQNHLFKKGSIR